MDDRACAAIHGYISDEPSDSDGEADKNVKALLKSWAPIPTNISRSTHNIITVTAQEDDDDKYVDYYSMGLSTKSFAEAVKTDKTSKPIRQKNRKMSAPNLSRRRDCEMEIATVSEGTSKTTKKRRNKKKAKATVSAESGVKTDNKFLVLAPEDELSDESEEQNAEKDQVKENKVNFTKSKPESRNDKKSLIKKGTGRQLSDNEVFELFGDLKKLEIALMDARYKTETEKPEGQIVLQPQWEVNTFEGHAAECVGVSLMEAQSFVSPSTVSSNSVLYDEENATNNVAMGVHKSALVDEVELSKVFREAIDQVRSSAVPSENTDKSHSDFRYYLWFFALNIFNDIYCSIFK